ncbi:TPA: hypothetical protein ACISXX_004937, partial [Salmonella enterica subsp. diarizonae serovar 61:l,v:z35]
MSTYGFSMPNSYKEYLSIVLDNAESVKAKEALVNSEELTKWSTQLYAIPKLSAYTQPKLTRARQDKNYTESKITLNSVLLDDTTFNSLQAQH